MTDQNKIDDYDRLKLEYTRLHEEFRHKQIIKPDDAVKIEIIKDFVRWYNLNIEFEYIPNSRIGQYMIKTK